MPGRWEGSTRRRRLPANWQALRLNVLRRDNHTCRWTTNGQHCGAPATEVDHIHRTAGDDMANLRALCTWHHRRKSSAEGNASRTRLTSRRTPEPHPGMA
jgi:5-methylcytosine-specific restriction protein A